MATNVALSVACGVYKRAQPLVCAQACCCSPAHLLWHRRRVTFAPCVQVQHLLHMALWGFQWRLLPAHFVLHVPHPPGAPAPGGWEATTMPLALVRVLAEEVRAQPQYACNVPLEVLQPLPRT